MVKKKCGNLFVLGSDFEECSNVVVFNFHSLKVHIVKAIILIIWKVTHIRLLYHAHAR